MAVKPISATRRRNVKPVSSIIRANLTRDIDCSAMAFPPEDGQFVMVNGEVGSNLAVADGVFVGANVAGVTATTIEASGLRMVWASALRSDRSASGDKRVPVIWMGPLEIETNLYLLADDGEDNNHVSNFAEGNLVSVAEANVAVEGSLNRLLLTPLPRGSAGWAVGQVTRSSAVKGASGVKIRVMLYDMPRFVGERI